MDYKVRDISLAAFGHREIEIGIFREDRSERLGGTGPDDVGILFKESRRRVD